MLNILKSALRKLKPTQAIQFDGYEEGRTPSGMVDTMPEDELRRLNHLLPWKCFTVDSLGRRFGSAAWESKRSAPQVIPDSRIEMLDRLFHLEGKTVLEVGCFEGIHTIALARLGSTVHAIDARIENVVKTLVRSNLFGVKPSVSLCDVENSSQFSQLPEVDILHHVGVLYHLKDPVTQLASFGRLVKDGLLLDTHYATPAMATSIYDVHGRHFRCYHYSEGGRSEVFSGMYDHAKWLLLEDIKTLLREAGFVRIYVAADEVQRNGPRVTLFAAKETSTAILPVDSRK